MKRVVNLKILACGGLLSIIAVLPVPLRAAAPAAQAPAAAGKSIPSPAASAAAPSAKPAPAVVSSASGGASPLLQMRLMPQKEIFSSREGLVMQFIFTAKAKAKLCLDKDILSQMQVSIFKSGQGKMPLKPLVIKDNSHLFLEPMKVVWLEAGQSLTVRANLKRFDLDGGSTWTPGEYSADATFNLCEQTPTMPVTEPGQETPVKAGHLGWFMIME